MSQKIKDAVFGLKDNCFCDTKTPWIHAILKTVAQEVLEEKYEPTDDPKKNSIILDYLRKRTKHAQELMNDVQMYYARNYMILIMAKNSDKDWSANCTVSDEDMKKYIKEVFDAVAGIHISDKPQV